MKESLEKIALSLIDERLVSFEGPFRFKFHEKHPKAPHSPIKVNLRFPPEGKLTQESVGEIAKVFYQTICENQLQYDCVVGVPRAGEPFAEVFSRLAWKPFLTLQKKEDIFRRRILPIIEEKYQTGWRVLLLDDVVVMADSKLEAVQALEANGLVVVAILILVDWQHGGRESLEKAGYIVIPIFSMEELLTFWLRKWRISQKKFQEVTSYLQRVRAYFKRQETTH